MKLQEPRLINLIHFNSQPLQYERYLEFIDSCRAKRRECILFCYHPPMISAGVQFKKENLLVEDADLQKKEIRFYQTKRGGDVTAHEPGQLMIYVHLDLGKRNISLSSFFNQLLEITQMTVLQIWGISSDLDHANPGLYLDQNQKVLSIGIDFRKKFTSHGMALNVKNDLATFQNILACGLKDYVPTSLLQRGADPSRTPDFIKAWYKNICNYLKII